MSPNGRIRPLLARVRRRVRVALLARGAVRGICAGLAVALVVILASKLFPLPDVAILAASLAGLGALIGALAGGLEKLPLARMAVLVDRAAKLAERVTTALELEDSREASPFTEPILRQAEDACARVRASDIVPASLPRDLRFAALGALLCVAASFVPALSRRAEAAEDSAAAIDSGTVRQLESRARRLVEAAREVRDADAERIGRQMDALADKLYRREIGKRDALARITDQKERLEEKAERERAKKEVHARLEQSPMKDVLKEAERGDGDAARSEAEKLARKVLGEEAEEPSREELRDDLREMARVAKADAGLHEKVKGALEALERAQGGGDPSGESKPQEGKKDAPERPQAEKQSGAKDAKGADKSGGKEEQRGSGEKKPEQERLAKAMKDLAQAAGRSPREGPKGGAVDKEELAKAFESLEQARAKVSGGEPQAPPESMRRPESAQAPPKQGGERSPQDPQKEKQADRQQARKEPSAERHNHPPGGT